MPEFKVQSPVSAVWKETKVFLPHPRVKVSIMGSLRDREVACSAPDRQGSNFESCVWRTVSSQSSHHPQKVLLAQFGIYVHKGGLKPDSFHCILSYMYDGQHWLTAVSVMARHFKCFADVETVLGQCIALLPVELWVSVADGGSWLNQQCADWAVQHLAIIIRAGYNACMKNINPTWVQCRHKKHWPAIKTWHWNCNPSDLETVAGKKYNS